MSFSLCIQISTYSIKVSSFYRWPRCNKVIGIITHLMSYLPQSKKKQLASEQLVTSLFSPCWTRVCFCIHASNCDLFCQVKQKYQHIFVHQRSSRTRSCPHSGTKSLSLTWNLMKHEVTVSSRSAHVGTRACVAVYPGTKRKGLKF